MKFPQVESKEEMLTCFLGWNTGHCINNVTLRKLATEQASDSLPVLKGEVFRDCWEVSSKAQALCIICCL